MIIIAGLHCTYSLPISKCMHEAMFRMVNSFPHLSLVLLVNDVFQLDTVEDLINLIKDRLDGSAKSGGVIVSN